MERCHFMLDWTFHCAEGVEREEEEGGRRGDGEW